MSLAIAYSRAQMGVDAPLVTVEVHLSNGLPSLSIVGLPERPTINMQIEELERMARDPRLAEYEAIKGLQAYLARRQIIIDEVEKATGSKTIWKQSDNYIGMRELLRKYGDYLVIQYPQFNSVFQNLLKS